MPPQSVREMALLYYMHEHTDGYCSLRHHCLLNSGPAGMLTGEIFLRKGFSSVLAF
jgi:hypothetical protein